VTSTNWSLGQHTHVACLIMICTILYSVRTNILKFSLKKMIGFVRFDRWKNPFKIFSVVQRVLKKKSRIYYYISHCHLRYIQTLDRNTWRILWLFSSQPPTESLAFIMHKYSAHINWTYFHHFTAPASLAKSDT
jgi:hypothetical protein